MTRERCTKVPHTYDRRTARWCLTGGRIEIRTREGLRDARWGRASPFEPLTTLTHTVAKLAPNTPALAKDLRSHRACLEASAWRWGEEVHQAPAGRTTLALLYDPVAGGLTPGTCVLLDETLTPCWLDAERAATWIAPSPIEALRALLARH